MSVRISLFFGLLVASGCVAVQSVAPRDLARLDESPRREEASESGKELGAATVPAPESPTSDVASSPLTTFRTSGSSAHTYPKQLRDLKGEPVELKPGVRLYVRLLDGHQIGGDVTKTEVRNGHFIWNPAGGRSQVEVPLNDIREAEVHSTDVGSTVLLVAGLTVAGVLATLLIIWLSSLSHISGRPLRINGHTIIAPADATTEWIALARTPDTIQLSAAARAALSAAWLRDARHEHASVPEFARISMILVGLGAPSRLVEGAHRAALEEIEHARRTFAMATAYSGPALGPGPLPELLSQACAVKHRSRLEAIRELAVESLADGCLGEGFAAAVAREAHAHAEDPAIRETLEVIMRDEASHAELSWEILAWSVAVGGEAIRDALRTKLPFLPRRLEAEQTPSQLVAELERHGRIDAVHQRQIFKHVRGEVISRAVLLIEPDQAHSVDRDEQRLMMQAG